MFDKLKFYYGFDPVILDGKMNAYGQKLTIINNKYHRRKIAFDIMYDEVKDDKARREGLTSRPKLIIHSNGLCS